MSLITGTDSWREMVKEAVGNDATLQASLVSMLVNFNEIQEGLYWAREFDIPKNQWPWDIVHAEEQDEDSNTIINILTFVSEKVYIILYKYTLRIHI